MVAKGWGDLLHEMFGDGVVPSMVYGGVGDPKKKNRYGGIGNPSRDNDTRDNPITKHFMLAPST